MRHRRLDRLERAMQPEPERIRFVFCNAPPDLPLEDHDEWHRVHGGAHESCSTSFTLNLGDCDINEDIPDDDLAENA